MTIETRKVEFVGAQGDRLAAALVTPVGKPHAYALFAHCFTCSKDIKAARIVAQALCARGIAVLRFDFTGLGNSEGDFANTNFSSNVEDLEAAAAFLARDYDAPSILVGHSLGGAAVIVAAARIASVKAVATIGAPAEADHVALQMSQSLDEIREKGAAQVFLANRPFTIEKQFLDDLERQTVIDCAGGLKKPLLLLHAPLDATVGVDNATKIFVAAKHPKSFVSLDRADHLLSDTDDARYAGEVIASWAGRYLDKADDEPAETRRADNIDGAAASMMAEHRFAVAAEAGGHPITIDADTGEGGDGIGPNPTRLLEASLAACTAMTIRMYAERKKWPLTSMKVRVNQSADADAHLARVLEKVILVEGDLDEAQRARLHEIGEKCPVHRMLSEGVEIRSEIA